MTLHKIFATMLFACLLSILGVSSQQVLAQSSDQASQTERKDDETNLDTQLYLLIATNQAVYDAKLPAALDPVMKQLRAALPFKNYRLAATLINRVNNGGSLNLKWVGGPLRGPQPGSLAGVVDLATGAVSASTPSFNEFRVNRVRISRDAEGQQVVRMEGFGFGARIPIQTASAVASNAPAAPIFNYEPTGLNTDISMREGEPVLVGTLNVGPSGDAIILVMSAKRTSW
jgi:hypothetical protein